ncbi:sigma-54-dependent Fis family transcriptional regulator, partial [candidate division KSB1 bacterium]|nr:sigma-54-dependent Fis family transcriptional regulator [candidate division KSB1 bacterium]
FVAHFIAHFNQKLNRRVQGATPKAEALLTSYHWPGNIRELRNVIERAMILCGGDLIHASDLPLGGQENLTAARAEDGEQFLSLEEVERLHIQRVYNATGRNISRTADILGMARNTLHSKIRRYKLDS